MSLRSAIFHQLQSVFVGALGLCVCVFLLWRNGGWPQFRSQSPLSWEEYYLLNISLLLTPAILYITLGSRLTLEDFGLCAGNRRSGVRFALVGWLAFLPVIAVIAGQPDFQDYYLSNLRANRVITWGQDRETIDWTRWTFCSLVMIMYMLAWEWFFRGFLLFGLRRSWSMWTANVFQATLFCILHLGKPVVEVASSLAGGILLGFVALRFRSMIACFLVHTLIYVSHEIAVILFFLSRSSSG